MRMNDPTVTKVINRLPVLSLNLRLLRRHAACSLRTEASHLKRDSLAGLAHAATLVSTAWFSHEEPRERSTMLRWALIFFIVAVVAAFLGFGGIAGTAAGIAEILFYAFLVVAVITLILGLMTGKKLL